MAVDSCGICGGDGRITNSFGNETRCPGCHGTGRRSEDGGLRDVTKTKPSHYRATNKAAAPPKAQGPATSAGIALANEVQASAHVSNDTKAKLTREIADHEATHGKCTETFIKKVKKQLRPIAR
ncbi:molecular chaperone DnaJ [Polyangium mundeleinium]|uniref:Molecular chaperone DnaJ n=1 Tax=Polyangium mundeleinium TaxID=2995306 RepID=A0ABT5EJN6_9BACT|nr:molecular chaperone DnaJ [Polyangium mundeleinium]MDC0742058.1 molecular chaperone DnaJ [Polyangium mundeleinium]